MDISQTYNYARPSGTWRLFYSIPACGAKGCSKRTSRCIKGSQHFFNLLGCVPRADVPSAEGLWDQRWHCRNINTFITYLKMKQMMMTIMTNDDWVRTVMECISAVGCTSGASFSSHLSIKNSNPCSIFVIDMSILLSLYLSAWSVPEEWYGSDSNILLSHVLISCTLHSIQLLMNEYKLLRAAIEDVS